MDKAWWVSAIQWAVWGVLMSLVMGWVAMRRAKARPPAEANRLVHPVSTLVVGIVCFVFFAGIAIISNAFPNKTVTWWTTTVFLGFAALAVPVIADYFLSRHQVSEKGLDYGRLLGPRGTLRWSELQSVRYSPSMKWFRLEGQSGQVARISAMLMGLPEFARFVLKHAPAGVIDDETRSILKETARGRPPSVWN